MFPLGEAHNHTQQLPGWLPFGPPATTPIISPAITLPSPVSTSAVTGPGVEATEPNSPAEPGMATKGGGGRRGWERLPSLTAHAGSQDRQEACDPLPAYLDVQVLKCSWVSPQQLHWIFGKEAHPEQASHPLVVSSLHHLERNI